MPKVRIANKFKRGGEIVRHFIPKNNLKGLAKNNKGEQGKKLSKKGEKNA